MINTSEASRITEHITQAQVGSTQYTAKKCDKIVLTENL